MQSIISIHHADALKKLNEIPDESVHLVLTDPPYFIDGFTNDWSNNELRRKASRAGVVGSIPVGMKFDPQQGRNFQAFMEPVFNQLIRILKPGGFAVAFSQARLYGRLAVAAEDAGFELRDMLGWVYEGQAKAFSQDHFVHRMQHLTAERRASILAELGGRKTPQLKPCIEPMALCQKPRTGTFVENWLKHQVGLVDTKQSLDGKFPGNLMPCPKPSKAEKGIGNEHPTVKPLSLLQHLIQLFTVSGQTVLDPFLGSGSTALAAAATGRNCIGIEIEKTYVQIAQERISKQQAQLQGELAPTTSRHGRNSSSFHELQ